MTNGMAWEDPPRTPRGFQGDWAAITAELRAHPNQWLRIFEGGPLSVVNAVRQDEVTAVHPMRPRGQEVAGFEVRTRNNNTGPPRTADFYLRWYEPE